MKDDAPGGKKKRKASSHSCALYFGVANHARRNQTLNLFKHAAHVNVKHALETKGFRVGVKQVSRQHDNFDTCFIFLDIRRLGLGIRRLGLGICVQRELAQHTRSFEVLDRVGSQ